MQHARLLIGILCLTLWTVSGLGCDTVGAPPDDVDALRSQIVAEQPRPLPPLDNDLWLVAGFHAKTITFNAADLVANVDSAVIVAVTAESGVTAQVSANRDVVTLSATDDLQTEESTRTVEIEVGEAGGGAGTLVTADIQLLPSLPDAVELLTPRSGDVALAGDIEFSWSSDAQTHAWHIAVGSLVDDEVVTEPAFSADFSGNDGVFIWSVTPENESTIQLHRALANSQFEGFDDSAPEILLGNRLGALVASDTLEVLFPATAVQATSPTSDDPVVFTEGAEELVFQVDYTTREPRDYDRFRVLVDDSQACVLTSQDLVDGEGRCSGFDSSEGARTWEVIAEVLHMEAVLDSASSGAEGQSFSSVPAARQPEVSIDSETFAESPMFGITGDEAAARHRWTLSLNNASELMVMEASSRDTLLQGRHLTSLTFEHDVPHEVFGPVPDDLRLVSGDVQAEPEATSQVNVSDRLLRGGEYTLTVIAENAATTPDTAFVQYTLSYLDASANIDLFASSDRRFSGKTISSDLALGELILVLEVTDMDGDENDRSLKRYFLAPAGEEIELPDFITEGLEVALEQATSESFRVLSVGSKGEVLRNWEGARRQEFERVAQ
ncbi:MAG: hypothetical protein JJ896_15190 [Rhodothermales bacterium]|nr:hypothetical protein [Rhodothermales bacterium]MBO6780998.1 hypothetical protein [Rhodothermales bacterium]